MDVERAPHQCYYLPFCRHKRLTSTVKPPLTVWADLPDYIASLGVEHDSIAVALVVAPAQDANFIEINLA